MLNDVDLKKLTPYFSEGKVVSIDVKDRGKKGREVLLEYDDGRKMVGDLNANPFRMQPLTGMTSIASYFARGKYGSNAWRGNCSGLLIKDLLNHYQPDTFGDLAVGSGTSIEVANDLGYTSANTVFSDLNPKYGGIDISGDDLDFPLMDFIFFHPPYYVFPGSSMPVYSGKGADGKGMWGDEINPNDGSSIPIEHEYLVVIRKSGPYVVPIHHVQFTQRDMRESVKATWASIIAMLLEDNGGRMTRDQLTEKMEKHPKSANNNHIAEKLRQELQRHPRMFSQDGVYVTLAKPVTR